MTKPNSFEVTTLKLRNSQVLGMLKEAKKSVKKKKKQNEKLAFALQRALTYIERQTCDHNETHRGGAIWEICENCGAKWADDEGGKPEFTMPAEFTEGKALLDEIKAKKAKKALKNSADSIIQG